jgi:hypothetical protein
MSKVKKMYFTQNETWDSNFVDEFNVNVFDSYIEAAQLIARELDAQSAHYPDERVFWLMDANHNTPVRVKVFAENVREYHAEIEDLK